MPGQLSAVTLREAGTDPEELRALQTAMESDEEFALRITGTHRVRPRMGFAETGEVRLWRWDSSGRRRS